MRETPVNLSVGQPPWPMQMVPALQSSVLDNIPPKLTDENSPDLHYSDGFLAVGSATIVPRPVRDNFIWETFYKRPRVRVNKLPKTPDLVRPPLSFQVLLYQGTSPGYEDSPQRFVYIGTVGKSDRDMYMLYQDLVDRLNAGHEQLYKNDRDKCAKNQTAFRVWNEVGDGSSNVMETFEWIDFYKELILPVTSKNSEDDVNDEQFARYCGFAAAAMAPSKEPYDLLTRFFNTPIPDVKVYFRISSSLGSNRNQATDWFSTVLRRVQKEFSKRAVEGFVPEICLIDIFPDSEAKTKEYETGKVKIGSHPIGLYDVWVKEESLDALRAAGMLLPPHILSASSTVTVVTTGLGNTVKVTKGDNTAATFPAGEVDNKTSTTITSMKINGARNQQRSRSHSPVITFNNSYATARMIWEQAGTRIADAEWVYRSALSYGGLGVIRGALSSQHRDNLILGTRATTTSLMRVEQFIKRYCIQEAARVRVSTSVKWGNNDPWSSAGNTRRAWMAPQLVYSFEDVDQPKSGRRGLPLQTVNFAMLQRLTPCRFDFEVGRHVEAHYFGWPDTDFYEEYAAGEEADLV